MDEMKQIIKQIIKEQETVGQEHRENLYIDKAKEAIKNMPGIKAEILLLKERMQQETNNKQMLARSINVKMFILKYYIKALEKIGESGAVLIDLYFNGLSINQVAYKYYLSKSTIKGYKYFIGRYAHVWE